MGDIDSAVVWLPACRLPAWRCSAQLSAGSLHLLACLDGWCHSFIHRQQRIHIGQCTLYTKVRSHTQCIFVSRLDDTAAAPTAAILQTGTKRCRRRRWMGCGRNKNAAHPSKVHRVAVLVLVVPVLSGGVAAWIYLWSWAVPGSMLQWLGDAIILCSVSHQMQQKIVNNKPIYNDQPHRRRRRRR